MKRSFFKVVILIAFLVIVQFSCKKDDDNSSTSITTNGKTTAVFNPSVTYGTMTDQDGNVYKIVTIGTQTWMAENLRTIKYNDGTSIPNVTLASVWENITTGAYCNYNNTISTDTIATYGRLYNWYVVNTGKLAPKGWHVPLDDEWEQLIDYLGGIHLAGDKLKENGTTHWNSPNTGATNETGFTALPSGCRNNNGSFGPVGGFGQWWSSSEYSASHAWYRYMLCHYGTVFRIYYPKKYAFSVRCVRD